MVIGNSETRGPGPGWTGRGSTLPTSRSKDSGRGHSRPSSMKGTPVSYESGGSTHIHPLPTPGFLVQGQRHTQGTRTTLRDTLLHVPSSFVSSRPHVSSGSRHVRSDVHDVTRDPSGWTGVPEGTPTEGPVMIHLSTDTTTVQRSSPCLLVGLMSSTGNQRLRTYCFSQSSFSQGPVTTPEHHRYSSRTTPYLVSLPSPCTPTPGNSDTNP